MTKSYYNNHDVITSFNPKSSEEDSIMSPSTLESKTHARPKQYAGNMGFVIPHFLHLIL